MEMVMSGRINTDIDDRGVATVRIDNPDHRNAMNDSLIVALIEAFERLANEPQCRVVVLRGAGGIFCAGRELRDLQRLNSSPLSDIEAAYERLRRVNEVIWYFPVPTVCVIEKYAFGLGATLVTWCDMAIAESDALIAFPEVLHGITPSPVVGALMRGVSRKAMMDLVLTGRRVGMDEAVQMGLINRAVAREALQADLDQTITQLLRSSPTALRRVKQFMWASEDASHRSILATAVAPVSIGLMSEETRDGIGAFLEKREPRWMKP
jgi:enoyl-CoA hydratase/carnithine racemase